MKALAAVIVGALLLPVAHAVANDTSAVLGAGGLVFVNNEAVRLDSEDLFISADEVRVTYRFSNSTGTDQHVLVAFPMPDITGSIEGDVALPTDDPDNPFGFVTTFDGQPVAAQLHQYVFAADIERSAELKSLGVPLFPYDPQATAAMDALSPDQQDKLVEEGLAAVDEYDAGNGWERHLQPVWTLKSTYSWDAVFPAGKTVTVEHRYKPSVGGTVQVTFLPGTGYSTHDTYQKTYCIDDGLVRAVQRQMSDPKDPSTAPYTESWLSYILTTGNNWQGPIGHFRLVVDKGAPDNLVSFCGQGVKKIGPTTFEMTADDYFPENDIDILILNRAQNR